STATMPHVGFVILERILSNVLLPAPFRPIMPTASPRLIEKDTFCNAQMVSSCAFARRKDNVIRPIRDSRNVECRLARPIRYCFDNFSTLISKLISAFVGLSRPSWSNYVREAPFGLVKVISTGHEHHQCHADRGTDQPKIDRQIREQAGAKSIHYPPARIERENGAVPRRNHSRRINDRSGE